MAIQTRRAVNEQPNTNVSGVAPRGEMRAEDYASAVKLDVPRANRHTPFGATLLDTGVLFRVCAPTASEVYLVTEADDTANWTTFTPTVSRRLEALGDGTFGIFASGLGEGAKYLFWINGPAGDTAGFKRDPYARELAPQPSFPNCPCVVRSAHSYPWRCRDWTPRPAHELVIYQLHVGTFWARDANGMDARKHGGRFLDVIERLPYLRSLGITAVEFLPVQESAGARSLGYNGTDIFSPETAYQISDVTELTRHLPTINAMLDDFGLERLRLIDIHTGPNQLKVLVDLCHLHGLSVIFNLVYHHAGSGFEERSIYSYHRQPGEAGPVAPDLTLDQSARGRVFAFGEEHVRTYLIDNARFFADEYAIDGIHCDEVTEIHRHGGDAFCRDLTRTLRAQHPGFLQIADYWDPDRQYPITQAPEGLGFDACSDDRLRIAVRNLLVAASAGEHAQLDFDAVAQAMYPRVGFADSASIHAIEAHDLVRWDPDAKAACAPRIAHMADPSAPHSRYACGRSRVAAGLLLTSPGIPLLFMGQEFLENKPWHDDIANVSQLLISWDSITGKAREAVDYHRFMTALIALRRSQPALQAGHYLPYHIHNDNRVFAFRRWLDELNDLVIVASLHEQPFYDYRIGMPRSGRWREIFNSDLFQPSTDFQTTGNGADISACGPEMHGLPASTAIDIPANGLLVIAYTHQ
jgi:1,4-alpha-glucan branching enzyme